MHQHIWNSEFGRFAYLTNHDAPSCDRTAIVFLGTMGINSTYFDFRDVFMHLDDDRFDIVSVDMLGAGFSGAPTQAKRSCEQLGHEIAAFLGHVCSGTYIVVSHSFNAIYVLHALASDAIGNPVPDGFSGFIGIDPAAPKVMLQHLDQLEDNLAEARQGQGTEVDINPALPEELQEQARDLYQSISGNPYELSELEEAPLTLKLTENEHMPDSVPTLSILSTLNYPSYVAIGNPYANANSYSMQVVLHGHHFIQWQHPRLIAELISCFVDEVQASR